MRQRRNLTPRGLAARLAMRSSAKTPSTSKRRNRSSGRTRASFLRRALVLLIFIAAAVLLFFILVSSQHLSNAALLETVSLRRRDAAVGTLAAHAAATIALQPGADEERLCVDMLARTSRIMFMVLGGNGYHSVRVRTILHSWARCVRHVLVFTDASANISGYTSERRYVYLMAGDSSRKRPYLPMTHMESINKLLSNPNSPAASVDWFFMVTDRTFVDVRALLPLLRPLDPTSKCYYGQVANATHKEAFGFHDYVDLNTGVLLSAVLLKRVADPAECHDQKSAGGTFDMFDAKLGNCVFYLGAYPKRLRNFNSEAEPPLRCNAGDGVNGVVSYGKVEPKGMSQLSACAGLLSAASATALANEAAAAEFPNLRLDQIAAHVMARETKLGEVIASCEGTWARPLPRVYYHVDRQVAIDAKYKISKGKWALSANLATALDAANGRKARIAALDLPPRPGKADGAGEHWKISHDKGMGWNQWLRYKMKAIFDWSVANRWAELGSILWHVYVDDDTYVLPSPLLALLSKYNHDEPHYFGRPLQEEGYPGFVGGGAGIVVSRAAALAVVDVRSDAECDPKNDKWAERTHQGGDAWLGDCCEHAGVTTDMEYGFYPQPPVANLFHLFEDAVAFHGVEDHRAMHESLAAFSALNASQKRSSSPVFDPRCVPVFVDHRYTCLPHFIIAGVPKAGTTSLYKYLLSHPEVLPAKDKELTFWGNFFSPKRRPGREEVTTEYLDKFPYIGPSDFKVTGEATPGYLYCLTCPTYILKYIPKCKLLITLRNPVVRAYSEYLNKREDQTVQRYLHKRIDTKMEKELNPKAPPFSKLIDDVARTMETCQEPNRTYSMMDEYTDAMKRDRCYVNPFAGEGRYARYLRNYLEVVPPSQLLVLNFDEWTNQAEVSMRRVFSFLQLAPFTPKVAEAHNTHLSRSVHVQKRGASNLSTVAKHSVSAGLSFRAYCILHEFFVPFQYDLDALLAQYSLPPMRWDTSKKGGKPCPTAFQHWPAKLATRLGRA